MRTYTRRNRAPSPAPRTAPAGPSVTELAAGAAPTPEQTGRRVDLPGEIREKMESSFGADFSNVKLYESQTVADAGARAVTQGNNIAFAPGQLDLASTSGQALLGHELSHVVSQARGESAGRGFLNDPGLEAQADRQGMMAARGESVYQGPVSPVGVSAASSAAGPMQAKKKTQLEKDVEKATENRKVEFGKDGDLTARKRAARAAEARGRLGNDVVRDKFFMDSITDKDEDLQTAYRKKFGSAGVHGLRVGTTAKDLREDNTGLTLGGQSGGDRTYSKAEGEQRYLEDHPEDILSQYDRYMSAGMDSVRQLVNARRKNK